MRSAPGRPEPRRRSRLPLRRKSTTQNWSQPCALLLRARLVPDRAGADTQAVVHIPLSQRSSARPCSASRTTPRHCRWTSASPSLCFVPILAFMDGASQQSTQPPLRAALYARLSETYDAAESVPTQLANAERHAGRRGWRVVARFKDDGYSAFKEIRRDDFVNLIGAIERDEIDVVIIRDVDRLTRNLPDWSRFEKAAIEHRVILSAYAGGDLDLSTPEGAYYGGMETLRAKRESAVRSVRVREAHDRIARQGKPAGGGRRWFGYTRVFANPEETVKRKRVILREETQPGRGRGAAGRRRADPARRDRRVDHPGVDAARHQAVRGRPVGRDVPGQHAAVAAAGWPAGMAGQDLPRDVAGDPRHRHARAAGEAVRRPVAPRPRGRPQAAPAVRRGPLRQVRQPALLRGQRQERLPVRHRAGEGLRGRLGQRGAPG